MSEPRRLSAANLEIELAACFKVPRELIRGHIEALETEIAQNVLLLAGLCRELPCGAHPRLLSLGQPALFVGGCGVAVIAPLAIVCADCGAWFCCRDCAYKHFGSHKEDPAAIVAARENV